MRNVDMHWQSKREWWEMKNGIPSVRADAPQEAKESYERYIEETLKELETMEE